MDQTNLQGNLREPNHEFHVTRPGKKQKEQINLLKTARFRPALNMHDAGANVDASEVETLALFQIKADKFLVPISELLLVET